MGGERGRDIPGLNTPDSAATGMPRNADSTAGSRTATGEQAPTATAASTTVPALTTTWPPTWQSRSPDRDRAPSFTKAERPASPAAGIRIAASTSSSPAPCAVAQQELLQPQHPAAAWRGQLDLGPKRKQRRHSVRCGRGVAEVAADGPRVLDLHAPDLPRGLLQGPAGGRQIGLGNRRPGRSRADPQALTRTDPGKTLAPRQGPGPRRSAAHRPPGTGRASGQHPPAPASQQLQGLVPVSRDGRSQTPFPQIRLHRNRLWPAGASCQQSCALDLQGVSPDHGGCKNPIVWMTDRLCPAPGDAAASGDLCRRDSRGHHHPVRRPRPLAEIGPCRRTTWAARRRWMPQRSRGSSTAWRGWVWWPPPPIPPIAVA